MEMNSSQIDLTDSQAAFLSTDQPQSLTDSLLKVAKVYDHRNMSSLKKLHRDVAFRGLLMKYP
jgi:hypothetical protein